MTSYKDSTSKTPIKTQIRELILSTFSKTLKDNPELQASFSSLPAESFELERNFSNYCLNNNFVPCLSLFENHRPIFDNQVCTIQSKFKLSPLLCNYSSDTMRFPGDKGSNNSFTTFSYLDLCGLPSSNYLQFHEGTKVSFLVFSLNFRHGIEAMKDNPGFSSILDEIEELGISPSEAIPQEIKGQAVINYITKNHGNKVDVFSSFIYQSSSTPMLFIGVKTKDIDLPSFHLPLKTKHTYSSNLIESIKEYTHTKLQIIPSQLNTSPLKKPSIYIKLLNKYKDIGIVSLLTGAKESNIRNVMSTHGITGISTSSNDNSDLVKLIDLKFNILSSTTYGNSYLQQLKLDRQTNLNTFVNHMKSHQRKEVNLGKFLQQT